ncbi:MAG: Uma2 family endonuclease [Euzebyales bacterium]|nr:Uma2 family endonuclease [Euzebyales bacterium]
MAAPTVAATGLTYADLLALPESGVRRELVDGRLIMSPSPSPDHQEVAIRLIRLLSDHADAHGGKVFTAPLDIFFTDGRVLQPDVCYLGPARLGQVQGRRLVAPPDLIVEVSSPSTRTHDLVVKRALYEAGGVPEFWLVDLEAQRVEAYRHDGRGYRQPRLVGRGESLRADALPGAALLVDDVLGRDADG